jgi:hypothetical protein
MKTVRIFASAIPPPEKTQRGAVLSKPSPAKLIQIKKLGFTWFYSSDSGLINGLRRFQIRIKEFLLAPWPLSRSRASRGAPFGSDHLDSIGENSDFGKEQLKRQCRGLMRRFERVDRAENIQ